MGSLTTQNLFYHLKRWKKYRALCSDYWSFYVHLGKCYLLHNLYIMQKVIRRRNRRRLGDRFREQLRDVEKDEKDAFKPVARHFNLPNHSKEHMYIHGRSLEHKFIFKIGSFNPHGINERFSFN